VLGLVIKALVEPSADCGIFCIGEVVERGEERAAPAHLKAIPLSDAARN
jgi:hypothetical protein